ncbi:MAG: type I DNA topoisomerase [Bacteroidia bacterium]|nr:type I DNA topoisomerase [Bacteroidia bacterium]
MSKNLLIVESPAKVKTITKFLGDDFIVKSSMGHIRDLPGGDHSVDIENGFKPTYEVSSDKKEIVRELKQLAKKAEFVWLASDEDREGEAISWHLFDTLELTPAKTKRIAFHEITKSAVERAIQNPRSINMDLVLAQQTRRILDRLVGFELSPILWKKVKAGLSAGRVQSVAVRLIVEREREIIAFHSIPQFKVTAEFDAQGKVLKAELNKRFDTEQVTSDFLETCRNAAFQVANLEVKPTKKTPAPPFTTSTLQQEASRKFGFSVNLTMRLAQSLYENGFITYMRTDSVNLSEQALGAAQETINQEFGEKYHQLRRYKTKTSGAQEAHEAIRPTEFAHKIVSDERNEQKLYELIRKRTLASQMADAQLEKTIITINILNQNKIQPFQFIAQGEVIRFDGFLKLYLESHDDDKEEELNSGLLPTVTKDQLLNYNQITAQQQYNRPPARYTEASLVKKMEELGIGRPSTYAPTITTIQHRNYVLKEDREAKTRPIIRFNLKSKTNSIEKQQVTENYGAEKSKLFPTDIGCVVNDLLVEYFQDIIDYKFTAKVEEEFDEIAHGRKVWNKMLAHFYQPFHEKVLNTIEKAERKSGERSLGIDPESGEPVTVRIGRFGPLVQIGAADGPTKPRYATITKGFLIETITLEEALSLFRLPRIVGEFEGAPLKTNNGRFGPYIIYGKNEFCSLPKNYDLLTVSAESCIEIIQAKRESDAAKTIREFPEINAKLMQGRWGPYLKAGKESIKLPKNIVPESLSLNDCEQLISSHLEKQGTTKSKAKSTGKKTTQKEDSAPNVPEKKTKAPSSKTPKSKK